MSSLIIFSHIRLTALGILGILSTLPSVLSHICSLALSGLLFGICAPSVVSLIGETSTPGGDRMKRWPLIFGELLGEDQPDRSIRSPITFDLK